MRLSAEDVQGPGFHPNNNHQILGEDGRRMDTSSGSTKYTNKAKIHTNEE